MVNNQNSLGLSPKIETTQPKRVRPIGGDMGYMEDDFESKVPNAFQEIFTNTPIETLDPTVPKTMEPTGSIPMNIQELPYLVVDLKTQAAEILGGVTTRAASVKENPLKLPEFKINPIKGLEVLGGVTTEAISVGKDLLVKDFLGFGVEKPKEENKEQIEQENEAANARAVAEMIRNVLAQNQEQKAINSSKETVRNLGENVSQEKINQLLGRSGSFQGDRGVYTDYEIAEARKALIEQKEAAEKAEKQQNMAEVNKKTGPNLDLNKVGEGGSPLSTTGGGAG